jgi:hypothetical protein
MVMTAAEDNRENQAARIRWLLERVPPEVYWEFTLNYAREHPFTEEEEVVSDGADPGVC